MYMMPEVVLSTVQCQDDTMLVIFTNIAPCGLQGRKNRAHYIFWPEIVKGIPNHCVDCCVSSVSYTHLTLPTILRV